MNRLLFICMVLPALLFSCCKSEKKNEELRLADLPDSLAHSIAGNAAFGQMASAPGMMIATRTDRYRILTVYKVPPEGDRNIETYEYSTYYPAKCIRSDDAFKYFMPGIDIVNGYNLADIALYDVERDTLTHFFPKPVLVKTLYFPGAKQDSLYRKPISRNYYMVTVYDEDTNRDSLINNRDLRRMYRFDEENMRKTALLPPGYSAIKSDYDYRFDAMYVYARFDENGNGTPEKKEPVAIFMIRLSDAVEVRKIY